MGKMKWLFIGIMCIFILVLIFPSMVILFEKDIVNKEKNQEVATLEDNNTNILGKEEMVAVFRNKDEIIEYISLEDYVVGVVAAEMPISFELESLKAQAITARTYVVRKKYNEANDNESADITDQVTDQVYYSDSELKKMWDKNYEQRINKVKMAVADTTGQILTYDGELIMATFFSTSNGKTENSEDYWQNHLPYLRSVDSSWDEDTPAFLAKETFTVKDIEEKINVKLSESDGIIGNEEKRTPGGRVESIMISGTTFTGKDLREKLSLRSSDFKMERKGSEVIITTKGFGHGVGMSQYGANEMAKSGKNYKEILAHYYTDTQISEVTSFLPQWVATK